MKTGGGKALRDRKDPERMKMPADAGRFMDEPQGATLCPGLPEQAGTGAASEPDRRSGDMFHEEGKVPANILEQIAERTRQRIEEEKRREAAAGSGSPAEEPSPEAASFEVGESADSGISPSVGAGGSSASEAPAEAGPAPAQMSEEMLRMLSEEVLRENSAAILAENGDENMEDISAAIMENLRKMMENGELKDITKKFIIRW